MSAPLNLARRPFRNERLPTLVLAVCLLLLAALSVRHALVARDLRSGGSRDVEREVVALEKEAARLRAEGAELRRLSPPADAGKEWAALRDLVDRRAFSWTSLFAALENALPPGVRLVSVSPSSSVGPIVIRLAAVGRSVDDALALPKALMAQGEFAEAFLDNYAETPEGVTISCTVRYVGRGGGGDGGAAAAPRANGEASGSAVADAALGAVPPAAGGAR